MSDPSHADIRRYIEDSRAVVDAALADAKLIATIGAIAERIAACLSAGGKVLLCGNGGSAADAQHIAGELLSRFTMEREPLAAVALTVDSSVLTAIGNDYGFEAVFERQVKGLGRPGDVLVAISTSGRSPNVLRALAAARARGLATIGLTGRDGGAMPPLCDIALRAPSDRTPLIQQIHIMAAHAFCGAAEALLHPGARA